MARRRRQQELGPEGPQEPLAELPVALQKEVETIASIKREGCRDSLPPGFFTHASREDLKKNNVSTRPLGALQHTLQLAVVQHPSRTLVGFAGEVVDETHGLLKRGLFCFGVFGQTSHKMLSVILVQGKIHAALLGHSCSPNIT